METMKIFVIVVTYNGMKWYERCFSSLRASTIPISTVVIDNASTDGSVEYIHSHFPEIFIIQNESNLGFGKANNIGMRYALRNKCDYVFLLNQDAWITQNSIEKLVLVAQREPDYFILSPMHLQANQQHIETGLLHYLDNIEITDASLFEDLYFNRKADLYETTYINAAAWLLPARTLHDIGGFDPIFYHYGEDDNYIQRVLFHGGKIGICPNAIIIHDTEQRIANQNKKVLTENKDLLVSLTNINNKINLVQYGASCIKKACSKLLSFRLHNATIYTSNFVFILKHWRSIKTSRQENMIVKANWL